MLNRLLTLSLLLALFFPVMAQKTIAGKKIKTISEYNLVKNKKEKDHFKNFNTDGLMTEELEYYADGILKSKVVYEYDSQKRCSKATKYGKNGKIDKVTTFEYGTAGEKIRESTFIPEKRYHSDKVFEYSYY